jgi:hypothetical protein
MTIRRRFELEVEFSEENARLDEQVGLVTEWVSMALAGRASVTGWDLTPTDRDGFENPTFSSIYRREPTDEEQGCTTFQVSPDPFNPDRELYFRVFDSGLSAWGTWIEKEGELIWHAFPGDAELHPKTIHREVSDSGRGFVILEVYGGLKRYVRVWDRVELRSQNLGALDWTWQDASDNAVLAWRRDDD